jgi:glycosyltransferase involved in cell wall biosynthesis
MSHPLVAIVTPVYNGAEFLAETMDCVQAQTYPNIVHILIDNGSTDGTGDIIERYFNKRVPVIVHRYEKTVPSRDNFNRAIEHVPPEAVYIRTLAADDIFFPDSTEEMVKLAEAHPEIGLVGCLHDCDGRVEDFLWPKDRQVFDGQEAIRMTLLRQGIIMPVQMMIRKSVADQFKPFYRPPLPGGYDMESMMNVLTRSSFGFVHKCLGFTRIHQNTHTAMFFSPATRSWTRDTMHYMRTFGPASMGAEYAQHFRRFQRYYVRRVVAWHFKDGKQRNLKLHYDALSEAGYPVNATRIVDAFFDWTLYRLGLRKSWTGSPGFQP